MNEPNPLPVAAQIYLALGLDHAPLIRQLAATIVARYVMEFHRYGYNPGCESMRRICLRFRLGDFAMALQVHFPPKSL